MLIFGEYITFPVLPKPLVNRVLNSALFTYFRPAKNIGSVCTVRKFKGQIC